MNPSPFRVLYRQFLFRLVDLDLLSREAQGDATKLLGQFGAVLVLVGVLCAARLLTLERSTGPLTQLLVDAWPIEYFLVSTTMLVTGILSVLTWDSVFPDRRDIFALTPLPVGAFTVFRARCAALAVAFSGALAALHSLASLLWVLVSQPRTSTPLDLVLSAATYRSFLAYWATMYLAAWLTFASLVCLQGMASLVLPRQSFLRCSALLQTSAFCLMVAGYFLIPGLATPQALQAADNQNTLAASPAHWLLGLFQVLNGSSHPVMTALASRAILALLAVSASTVTIFLLAYRRSLRRIAEEGELRPMTLLSRWMPHFGGSISTAIVQFSARTLLRSRQHRMILSFYLGLAFAISILFLKSPEAVHLGIRPILLATVVITIAWVVGTRVVFTIPMELRGNWIFRLIPQLTNDRCLPARRRAMHLLALTPAAFLTAAITLYSLPVVAAAGHLFFVILLGMMITEFCLWGKQTIPFTCAWLPGRANFHLTFWLCVNMLLLLVSKGVQYEESSLQSNSSYLRLAGLLGLAVWLERRWTRRYINRGDTDVDFEYPPSPTIQGLNLKLDGLSVNEDRIK